MDLTNKFVTELAESFGFSPCGFAPVTRLREETEQLETWLKRGFHAGMKYMERNIEMKLDPNQINQDFRSVISLGLNYYFPVQHTNSGGFGKISRYAWGDDYHAVTEKKLEQFISALQEADPGFAAAGYCDTGPVLDKAWAVRAGTGWIGKHSNIINKVQGSWFFIINIFTNREFVYSPAVPDHCGSCTRCIDACPTQAIVEDYIVDSNRCISYLTIENKSDIPSEFSGRFEGWLFGCDICQDVCPWNIKFSTPTGFTEFLPRNGETGMHLHKIREMSSEDFKNRFDSSPVLRAKLRGLQRNAEFLETPEEGK